MIKRYFAFILVILLIFINLPVITLANNENVITVTIRVGYVKNYGIVKSPSFNGYEGFGYEYLNKILEYTKQNYQLEFIECSWNEGLTWLDAGQIDILAPAHYDTSREKNFIYSTNEFAIDTSFLACTNLDAVATNSFSSLEGCTIGIQEGNVTIKEVQRLLDENNVSANIIETTIGTFEEEVERQLYDYVLVTSLIMEEDMNLAFNLGTQPTYLMAGKHKQDLIDDLDFAMKQVDNNEYLYKELLYLKYFDHGLTVKDYISVEEFKLLQSQPIYNVGLVNFYNDFGYNNTDIIGIYHDLMEEMASISGINVNYIPLDTNIVDNDFSQFDLYFIPVGYEVDNNDLKSDPYLSTPLLLVENINNNKDSGNIGFLYNNKLNKDIIDYFIPNQTIFEFDNIQDLYSSFTSGTIDNMLISSINYNSIYNKILDVEHTAKATTFSINPVINFNENFTQEKVDIFNKILTYIDDDFIQTSELKNISMINSHEKFNFYIFCIKIFFVLLVIAVFILILLKRQKDLTIEKIATHDELTGLITFSKFVEDTRALLDEDNDIEYTLVSLDIDNFKYINEIYNYEVGSSILKHIATSVSTHISPNLPMTRVLADNFLVLVRRDKFIQQIDSLLKTDNDIIREINSYIDEHYVINFSVGSYNIDDKSLEISYMIDCCNLARSFSKMELGNTFNTFSEDMKEKETIKNNIVARMNKALIDKEFVLYYQPKFDIVTKKIEGAEALVRWFADGQMIPPNNFIPLFEANGFIENLDYYVVEQACEFIAKYNAMDLPVISVNLSGITIMKKDVVDKVMQLVRKHKIKPTQLDLEITESAFVEHFEVALDSIDQFRELGFTISMDDFGAGISSLNRLKEISIDILKIDREFIVGSLENDKGSKIIANIVNMAKDLKLETVAEGIETDEQLDFLRSLGCDIGQGYWFSRPLPQKDFIEILENEDLDDED